MSTVMLVREDGTTRQLARYDAENPPPETDDDLDALMGLSVQ